MSLIFNSIYFKCLFGISYHHHVGTDHLIFFPIQCPVFPFHLHEALFKRDSYSSSGWTCKGNIQNRDPTNQNPNKQKEKKKGWIYKYKKSRRCKFKLICTRCIMKMTWFETFQTKWNCNITHSIIQMRTYLVNNKSPFRELWLLPSRNQFY